MESIHRLWLVRKNTNHGVVLTGGETGERHTIGIVRQREPKVKAAAIIVHQIIRRIIVQNIAPCGWCFSPTTKRAGDSIILSRGTIFLL